MSVGNVEPPGSAGRFDFALLRKHCAEFMRCTQPSAQFFPRKAPHGRFRVAIDGSDWHDFLQHESALTPAMVKKP